jgi:hypothetical protein
MFILDIIDELKIVAYLIWGAIALLTVTVYCKKWFVKKTKPLSSGINTDIEIYHTDKVELYYNSFSYFSQLVRICLEEKGVEYKSIHIDLIETGWYQSCSPEYQEINPECTVPVLVKEGNPIYNSLTQLTYIDLQFEGPSLCPSELDKEVDHWIDQISLNGYNPSKLKSLKTRIGCCIPGLTFPLLVALVESVSYKNIL